MQSFSYDDLLVIRGCLEDSISFHRRYALECRSAGLDPPYFSDDIIADLYRVRCMVVDYIEAMIQLGEVEIKPQA